MARTVAFDCTNWGVSGYNIKFYYKATPPSGTWTSYPFNSGADHSYGGDYGNGYWAVGGDSPVIRYTNTLGGSWSTATEPFTVQINCIQYGSDEYWVAGGSNNEIATAYQTPATFTARTSPFDAGSSISNAAYDGSTYWVIVGTTGQLGYATDPTGSWTVVDEPGPFTTSDGIGNVAYGNGIWVIVGTNGKMAYATDPTAAGNWTSIDPGFSTSSIYMIAYGNGYWIAGSVGGKLAYSQVTII